MYPNKNAKTLRDLIGIVVTDGISILRGYGLLCDLNFFALISKFNLFNVFWDWPYHLYFLKIAFADESSKCPKRISSVMIISSFFNAAAS